MKSQLTSLLLIGCCFAVPASTFSWAIVRTAPNLWWLSIPAATGLESALLSMLIWRFAALKCDNMAVDMLCGASVGVLSHPFVAALSVFVAMSLSAAGFIPHDVGARPLPAPSVLAFLKGVGVIVFWWCLIALCGVGWVTMVIGGVVGLIIGSCRFYFLNYGAGVEREKNVQSRRDLQSEFVNFRTRKILMSNIAALFLVSLLTGGLVALVVIAEPERIPEFVIEQAR